MFEQYNPLRYGALNKGFSVFLAVGALSLGCCSSIAQSQEREERMVVNGLSSGVDCTEVNIAYESDKALTQAEKIQLMDQAFFDSLNKFDLCQNSAANTSSADRGAQEGGNPGGGGSAASSGMSGTEAPADQGSGDLAGPSQLNGIPVDPNHALVPVGAGSAAHVRNGKLPEDIPSADNDSILEAQIRHAATNESDPEIREKLWDEYRKYKGISNGEK
ncbi:MAG: hypothetical protein V7731_05780 [Amphritea sp.]